MRVKKDVRAQRERPQRTRNSDVAADATLATAIAAVPSRGIEDGLHEIRCAAWRVIERGHDQVYRVLHDNLIDTHFFNSSHELFIAQDCFPPTPRAVFDLQRHL
jgi:hypothetical protein